MHPGEGSKPLSAYPAWRRANRFLWLLAPLLLLVTALGIRSMLAERVQADAIDSRAAAAENHRYCEKWGMPAGTQAHVVCVHDLVDIRARTEERMRGELAADAGF